MAEVFSNKAETTLNGAIDDNDTSLIVSSATGFPTTGNFRIVVSPSTASEEIMIVTGVSGTTFTIGRATEAIAGVQTAFSHADGAEVKHVLTAGALTLSGDWDVIRVKTSDETVTNSVALVNDPELFKFIEAGQIWRYEVEVLYTSDATGDYKCNLFNAGGGSATFWERWIGTDSTSNTINLNTGTRTASNTGANITAGGGSTAIIRHIFIEGVISNISINGNFRFRAAQNTQTSGQSAVTKAGSILRMKQLL